MLTELEKYKEETLTFLRNLKTKKQKAKWLDHEIKALIWNFNLRDFFWYYNEKQLNDKNRLLQKKCRWLKTQLEKNVDDVKGYQFEKKEKKERQQILTIIFQKLAKNPQEQLNFLQNKLHSTNELLIQEIKTHSSELVKKSLKMTIELINNLLEKLCQYKNPEKNNVKKMIKKAKKGFLN